MLFQSIWPLSRAALWCWPRSLRSVINLLQQVSSAVQSPHITLSIIQYSSIQYNPHITHIHTHTLISAINLPQQVLTRHSLSIIQYNTKPFNTTQYNTTPISYTLIPHTHFTHALLLSQHSLYTLYHSLFVIPTCSCQ